MNKTVICAVLALLCGCEPDPRIDRMQKQISDLSGQVTNLQAQIDSQNKKLVGIEADCRMQIVEYWIQHQNEFCSDIEYELVSNRVSWLDQRVGRLESK